MKDKIIITKATQEDAESIITININSWKTTYKNILPDDILNNLDSKKETAITKCKNKIQEYVVCKYNNKIIGFARYGPNKKNYSKDYAEVYALYVKDNFQKKKVGSSILNYIFNNLKNNYKYVLISTLKSNKANLFYKKVGGTFQKEIPLVIENTTYKENLYKFVLNKSKKEKNHETQNETRSQIL